MKGWMEENRKWEEPRGWPLPGLHRHFMFRMFKILPLGPIECVKYSQDEVKQEEGTEK